MRARCNKPGDEKYKFYGARGIRVCDEWNEHFPPFREWAISNGYNDSLTIDRIDPRGDYTPKNGSFKEAADIISDEKYPRSVLDFKRPHPQIHPTEKPVALLEYLIKTYTNEGEMVLDNTMGSGSTGVACVNTGRNFIGIELNDEYFNIASERIKKAEEDKAGRLF